MEKREIDPMLFLEAFEEFEPSESGKWQKEMEFLMLYGVCIIKPDALVKVKVVDDEQEN